MGEPKQTLTIEELGKNLATFAIDRTDLKELLAKIPEDSTLNKTTIEYELQILKILSVGWAISFFMAVSDKNREALANEFWEDVREVSDNISKIAGTTSGADINYFEIIKERLNTYLKVMGNIQDETQNPASIMGPAFAVTCGHANDALTILIGTKMFTLTMGSIKEYLNSVTINNDK